MGRSAQDEPSERGAAERVVRTLRDAGHTAYFAGGCVRDELLGLTPTDYDVATDATPDRICALFPRTAEVGASFGVVLVKLGTQVIEVATFRSDGVYSDRRRPDSVTFSDPRQDAQRRDYTVNALFLDPVLEGGSGSGGVGVVGGGTLVPGVGYVIDFVGGMADLKARVLRAVGDADQRLSEDHLRGLRAARLAAKLGFSIDPATAGAIRRHAAELRGVSRERVGEEVRRMAMHPSRAAAAALLLELGLEGPVFGVAATDGPRTWMALSRLDQNAEFATVLAAWAVDLGVADPGEKLASHEVVMGWRKTLSLSNEDRGLLKTLLDTLTNIEQNWSGMTVARQKRLASREWFGQLLILLRAVKPPFAAEVTSRVEELAGTPGGLWPQAWVTGDDLMAMGRAPGPGFKAILDGVLDAQLEGKVRSREEALELARRMGV